MKTFLISLLSLISFNIIAQNQFLYKYSTQYIDVFYDLVQKNDTVFYLIGGQAKLDTNTNINIGRVVVIEMGSNGNIYSTNILSNFIDDLQLSRLVKIDSNIYAFGSLRATTGGYNNIVIKYDINFNEISRKYYLIDNNLIGNFVKDVFISDSNIYILNFEVTNSLIRYPFSILKLNMDFDSLAFFSTLPISSAYAFNILDDKHKGIFVFTYLYKFPGYGQIVHFDSSLNQLSVTDLPDLMHFNNNSMWISDTTFVLTARTEYIRDSTVALGYYDWDMGLSVFDTSLKQLDYKCQIRRHGEESPGWSKNLTPSLDGGYYYVGMQNIDSHIDTSKVILTKLDSNFNLIWEKYIWDGLSNLESYGIYTMPDSSIILLVDKSDLQYGTTSDAWVYKISKDGEVVFTSKIGERKIDRLKIFPNPATEYINIEIAESDKPIIEYKIYDLQGKLILADKCFSKIVKLYTSNLKTGSYFIIGKSFSGEIYSGRFIKN